MTEGYLHGDGISLFIGRVITGCAEIDLGKRKAKIGEGQKTNFRNLYFQGIACT